MAGNMEFEFYNYRLVVVVIFFIELIILTNYLFLSLN
jgi:hypothetical protein